MFSKDKNSHLLLTLVLIIFSASCDTISVDFSKGNCVQSPWSMEVFLITKINELEVHMSNVSTGEAKTVNKMDKGWEIVNCPRLKGKISKNKSSRIISHVLH